jgi:hypothetical protein
MKSSFHSLIIFLPLFCNCQLNSVPLLPSSYPGKLTSRNSTTSSQLNSTHNEHIAQNNTPHSITAHKTTRRIKDTLHTMSTSHKITHHTQTITAHKTTRTIKDTLHTMNTSHKITHHTQTNTAHKTTQTIKDTLHTMNTITTATNTINLCLTKV